jgi:hypothetical protein
MQWFFWLIALVFVVAAFILVYRADVRKSVPYPWLTAGLRAVAISLAALLLLMPAFTIRTNKVEKPVVVHLQDNSKSVAEALGADSASYRAQTEKLLSKLETKYRVVRLGFGNTVRKDSTFTYDQAGTDISSALSHVREYYGLDNVGAIILASDGIFNQGTNPLYQDLPAVGALYTIGLGDSATKKDIRVSGIYANRTATINASFEVRADINADLCKGFSGEVALKEGAITVASQPLLVGSNKYDRPLSFIIKTDKPGLHHYTLVLPTAEGEENVVNNRKDVFVEVAQEKKRILIAFASPHPDVNAIKEALAPLPDYAVTVCAAENLPASIDEFDALVLHGLPSLRMDVSYKIKQAGKPVWFIVTGQTNFPALQNVNSFYGFSLLPSAPHDVIAVQNTTFNLFNLPVSLGSVMDAMPPLTSYVMRVVAMPAGNGLFKEKAPPQAPQNDLWTLIQGNVNSAVLAGEGLWRWRLYEYKTFNQHTVMDECIRQTIMFLVSGNKMKPFQVMLPKPVWKDSEPVSVMAVLHNANQESITTQEVYLSIMDSAGKKQNFTFERGGVGYHLNVGVWAGGNYTYTARTEYNGKLYTYSGAFAVASTPVELLERKADFGLLYSLSKKYNGAFYAYPKFDALADSLNANKQMKPLIKETIEVIPLVDKKWYFLLLFLVLIGEWLLRKYWMAQ